MVDTQRFQLGPYAVQLVSEVMATLAHHGDGITHAFAVASYLPLDVDSVARILDSLEEDDDVRRVQREDGLCYYERAEGPRRISLEDLQAGRHLDDCPGFNRNLGALRQDEDWLRKVREQHELLGIAAAARHRTVELGYMTSRSELTSAKIQSILNDFAAEGYLEVHYVEDDDRLEYTFPPFDYPADRRTRNLAILETIEPRPTQTPTQRYWLLIVIAAAVLLLIVILTRFAAL